MSDTDHSPLQIGPLIPFLCEYSKPDGRYGITLYGLTEEQVVKDNRAKLQDLTVLGVLHEVIPCRKDGDEE
jgi:hypothetical protein